MPQTIPQYLPLDDIVAKIVGVMRDHNANLVFSEAAISAFKKLSSPQSQRTLFGTTFDEKSLTPDAVGWLVVKHIGMYTAAFSACFGYAVTPNEIQIALAGGHTLISSHLALLLVLLVTVLLIQGLIATTDLNSQKQKSLWFKLQNERVFFQDVAKIKSDDENLDFTIRKVLLKHLLVSNSDHQRIYNRNIAFWSISLILLPSILLSVLPGLTILGGLTIPGWLGWMIAGLVLMMCLVKLAQYWGKKRQVRIILPNGTMLPSTGISLDWEAIPSARGLGLAAHWHKAIDDIKVTSDQAQALLVLYKTMARYDQPWVGRFKMLGSVLATVNGLLVNALVCLALGVSGLQSVFFAFGITMNPVLTLLLSVLFAISGAYSSYRITGNSIRAVFSGIGEFVVGKNKRQVMLKAAPAALISGMVGIGLGVLSQQAVVVALSSSAGLLYSANAVFIGYIVLVFTIMAAGLLFGNFLHSINMQLLARYQKSHTNLTIFKRLAITLSLVFGALSITFFSPILSALTPGMLILTLGLLLCSSLVLATGLSALITWQKTRPYVMLLGISSSIGFLFALWLGATVGILVGVVVALCGAPLMGLKLHQQHYQNHAKQSYTNLNSQVQPKRNRSMLIALLNTILIIAAVCFGVNITFSMTAIFGVTLAGWLTAGAFGFCATLLASAYYLKAGVNPMSEVILAIPPKMLVIVPSLAIVSGFIVMSLSVIWLPIDVAVMLAILTVAMVVGVVSRQVHGAPKTLAPDLSPAAEDIVSALLVNVSSKTANTTTDLEPPRRPHSPSNRCD